MPEPERAGEVVEMDTLTCRWSDGSSRAVEFQASGKSSFRTGARLALLQAARRPHEVLWLHVGGARGQWIMPSPDVAVGDGAPDAVGAVMRGYGIAYIVMPDEPSDEWLDIAWAACMRVARMYDMAWDGSREPAPRIVEDQTRRRTPQQQTLQDAFDALGAAIRARHGQAKFAEGRESHPTMQRHGAVARDGVDDAATRYVEAMPSDTDWVAWCSYNARLPLGDEIVAAVTAARAAVDD